MRSPRQREEREGEIKGNEFVEESAGKERNTARRSAAQLQLVQAEIRGKAYTALLDTGTAKRFVKRRSRRKAGLAEDKSPNEKTFT